MLTALARPAAAPRRRLVRPRLAVAGRAGAGPGRRRCCRSTAGRRPSATAVVAAIQGDVPHARSLPGPAPGEHGDRRTTRPPPGAGRGRSRRAAGPPRTWSSGRRTRPTWIPRCTRRSTPRSRPRSRAIDRPVLVGAVLENPLRNTGQLWLPGRGPVADVRQAPAGAVRRVHPVPRPARHITSLVNAAAGELHRRATGRWCSTSAGSGSAT